MLKYHYTVYSFPELIFRCYLISGKGKRPRIDISDLESSADEWIPDEERITVKSTRSLYPCEHCDQTFSRKRMLKTHTSLEHNQKLYICSRCPFRTVMSARLHEHQVSEHPGLFKCNVCDHVAASMVVLKAHKKVEHEGKMSNYRFCSFIATK